MLGKMFIDSTKDLASARCILPISIDLFYKKDNKKEHLQEGENIAETVHVLNQLNLTECIIVIADMLQRHTAKIQNNALTDVEANEQAEKAGLDWIRRNEHLLARLNMPYKITYWNDWKASPHYEKQRVIIQSEYDTKKTLDGKPSTLKSSVGQVVRHFINGFARGHEKGNQQELEPFDVELAVQLSKEYLLEEITVIELWAQQAELFPILLPKDQHATFMAYPFGNSTTSEAVYDCINSRCDTENFHIEKIKKAESPTETGRKSNALSKKSKQKEPAERHTSNSKSSSPQDESDVADVQQTLLSTLRISKLTAQDQIKALQGATEYVVEQLKAESHKRDLAAASSHEESTVSTPSQKNKHPESIQTKTKAVSPNSPVRRSSSSPSLFFSPEDRSNVPFNSISQEKNAALLG